MIQEGDSRNGVGIVVDGDHRKKIVEVKLSNYKVIRVKILLHAMGQAFYSLEVK